MTGARLPTRALLTTTEAAAYCGFKTGGAIRKAHLEGRLRPAGRRGGTGTWTWDVAELDRFMRGAPSTPLASADGLGQVRKHEDEPTAAHTLYNLIDRRHGRLSTAVTSNIDLRDWGRYLGDATVAAAILDRLAMHAIRLDIDGPSYRQHVATERARKPSVRAKPATT